MTAYHVRITSFTDGATTFTGNTTNVHAKSGSADGPEVVHHMVRNDAGAIIDLDGTGAATLVPPIIEANFIFNGAHPNDNPQLTNLYALKGKHGTLAGVIPEASSYINVNAPARLIEIQSTWDGAYRAGAQAWIAVKVVWQLKGFF